MSAVVIPEALYRDYRDKVERYISISETEKGEQAMEEKKNIASEGKELNEQELEQTTGGAHSDDVHLKERETQSLNRREKEMRHIELGL